MFWLISIILAVPAALLHAAGLPLIWAVIIPTAVLVAVAAATKGKLVPAVTSAAAVTLALAGILAVGHGSSQAAAAGPPVVTFSGGQYTSYGSPSFSVDVANSGQSAASVHSVTVRFVNTRDASVITDVTEHAGVTVAAGQSAVLTYSAPQQVVNTAIQDRQVAVTVVASS